MAISIRSDGSCNCPPGQCAYFLDNDQDCINRLSGEVVTANCRACHPNGRGATWHQNGECLKCRHAASAPTRHTGRG